MRRCTSECREGGIVKFKMIMMVVMLLVLGVGLPMLLPGPNGKPMMSWRDWVPDTNGLDTVVGEIKEIAYSANEIVEKSAGVNAGLERPKLYKWQDEQGTWHFSDQPSETANNQVVEALPQTKNTMAPPPEIDFGREEGQSSSTNTTIPLPMTVPAANIPKLIEDAKNLQKLADKRAKQFNKM